MNKNDKGSSALKSLLNMTTTAVSIGLGLERYYFKLQRLSPPVDCSLTILALDEGIRSLVEADVPCNVRR